MPVPLALISSVHVRILSMGRLHHAFTGTGAAALAVATAVPGTVAHAAAYLGGQGADAATMPKPGSGSENEMKQLILHHTSGSMMVGALVSQTTSGGPWIADKVAMSRSARRLMDGGAYVPRAVWPAPAAPLAQRGHA